MNILPTFENGLVCQCCTNHGEMSQIPRPCAFHCFTTLLKKTSHSQHPRLPCIPHQCREAGMWVGWPSRHKCSPGSIRSEHCTFASLNCVDKLPHTPYVKHICPVVTHMWMCLCMNYIWTYVFQKSSSSTHISPSHEMIIHNTTQLWFKYFLKSLLMCDSSCLSISRYQQNSPVLSPVPSVPVSGS